MSKYRLTRWAMTLGIVGALGCSNSPLRQLNEDANLHDNKLLITGSFCATSPTELDFPIKISFVVDNSDSLNVNDPDFYPDGTQKPDPTIFCLDCTNQRQRAVREIWERYEDNENYYFSLIMFPAGANVNDPDDTTNGFVQGNGDGYLAQISNPIGLTPMLQGLDEARRHIVQDLLRVDPRERNRLRYVVVLFSDGIPQQYDEDNGQNPLPINQDPADILQMVRDIKDLERVYRLGNVTINAAFLTGDPDLSNAEINRARDMMLGVAQIGDGVYSEFDSSGQTPITFRDFDFSSFVRSFSLKSLQATNRNALAKADGTLDLDSDGDGMPDDAELELGLDPTHADLDGDLCSDLVEMTIGTDPLITGDCECEEDKTGDTDGDGLRDCEEILIGTREYVFDTDLDGLLDRAEFVGGTSPGVDDALLDSDLDGVINRDEIIQHTLAATTDPATRPTLAYDYIIQETGLTADNRQCYDFEVSNISLAETLAGPDGRAGINNICVHILESSRDATLDDHGILRVGCYEIQYLGQGERNPPGNVLEVQPDDEERFLRYE